MGELKQRVSDMGDRKFVSMWILQLIFTMLLWFTKLDAVAFGSLMFLVWGSWLAGDVIEHVKGVR